MILLVGNDYCFIFIFIFYRCRSRSRSFRLSIHSFFHSFFFILSLRAKWTGPLELWIFCLGYFIIRELDDFFFFFRVFIIITEKITSYVIYVTKNNRLPWDPQGASSNIIFIFVIFLVGLILCALYVLALLPVCMMYIINRLRGDNRLILQVGRGRSRGHMILQLIQARRSGPTTPCLLTHS